MLEGVAGWTTNERNRRDEFNLLQSPARLAAHCIAPLVKDSGFYRLARMVGHRLNGPTPVQVAGSTEGEKGTRG